MKIGIIGASGKSGRYLTAEALLQGHDVTAIVRDGGKITDGRVGILVRDLFAVMPDDVTGFDVVIDAFRAPEGQEEQHRTSMIHLIGLFEHLPKVRLLVVGGAGSLYTDTTRTKHLMDGADFPPAFLPTAINMGSAFENLRKSKVNWTCLSPAAVYDPNGVRTGKYTLGDDVMILNQDGESYVSYADYAIAMIDEVTRKAYVNKRFTVVSDRNAAA